MAKFVQKYTIYGADGKERCTVKKLEYNGTYMGERYVSLTVEWPHALAWQVGDYLDYRGDHYVLDYIPAMTRQYRSGSRKDAVVYDSIKMKSATRELEHCQMVDVVIGDNQIPYTAMGSFSFYVEKAQDFARRVQAVLDEAYGSGVWTVVCGQDVKVNKDKAMAISGDTSVMAAMAQFNNDFDVNFTIEGRTITFGGSQQATGHSFVYGKGNGLKKLTQSVRPDQKIVTKGKFYGSTRNIPYRYYVTIGRSVMTKVTKVTRGSSYSFVEIHTDLDWNALYFTSRKGDTQTYNVTLRVGDVEKPAVASSDGSEDAPKCRFYITTGVDTDAAGVSAIADAASVGSTVYITRGVEFSNVPSTSWYIPTGAPDNYSIHNLMLPGFPKESLDAWVRRHASETAAEGSLGRVLWLALQEGYRFSTDRFRPYILAPTYDRYGMRDGEKVFDQDDDKNGWWEIYPSLEGMTVSGLQGVAGYVSGMKTASQDGRVDKILTGTSVKDNGTSASGSFEAGQKDVNGVLIETTVKVTIPNLGFNPWDYRRSGETPTLSMKNGMCGGRDFEIVNCIRKSDPKDGYELTLNRSVDSSTERNYPYDVYPIRTGDEFVLVGIELPDAYVEASAARLLVQSLDWLSKNCREEYTYEPEIDDIWMANHPEEKLTEGMKMLVADEELGIEVAMTISQLTIKENQNDNAVNIPHYEVRLDDEQEATLMQSVEATVKGVVGKTDFSQSVAGFQKELQNYLRRDRDEKTAWSLEVGKDMTVGGDLSVGGKVEGKRVVAEAVDADNVTAGQATIEELTVTKRATFFELVIDKVRAAGGSTIYAAADGFKVDKVVSAGANGELVALLWKASDGEKSRRNMWVAGDQAICKTFNAAEGTSTAAKDKYYWVAVADAGRTEREGELYNFISVDPAVCDGTLNPEVGDEISMLGHRGSDTDRQGAVYLAAYSSMDPELKAPLMAEYRGINDFSLSSHLYTAFAANKNVIRGDFFMEGSDEKLRSIVGMTSTFASRTGDGVRPDDDKFTYSSYRAAYQSFSGSGFVWEKRVTTWSDGVVETEYLQYYRPKDGTSVSIVGSLTDSNDLPKNYTGNKGDGYLIDGHLWVWTGSSWADAGNIKGEQGDPGKDGSAAWNVSTTPGTVTLQTNADGVVYNGLRTLANNPAVVTVVVKHGPNACSVVLGTATGTNCACTAIMNQVSVSGISNSGDTMSAINSDGTAMGTAKNIPCSEAHVQVSGTATDSKTGETFDFTTAIRIVVDIRMYASVLTNTQQQLLSVKSSVKSQGDTIASHTTALNQQAEQISATAASVEGKADSNALSALNEAVEAYKSSTNGRLDGIDTDILNHETSIDDLVTDMSETKDRLSDVADGQNNVVARLGELEVKSDHISASVYAQLGSKNLLRDTDFGGELPQLTNDSVAQFERSLVGSREAGTYPIVLKVTSSDDVWNYMTLSTVYAQPGKTYTLSAWVKNVSGALFTKFAYVEIQAMKDGQRINVGTSASYTKSQLPQGEWQRMQCTLTIPSDKDFDTLMCFIGKQGRGEVLFSQPQLEEGTTATDWESQGYGELLRRTGINIYDRLIDMQADKFRLRNNEGEQTMGVDAYGRMMINGVTLKNIVYSSGVLGNNGHFDISSHGLSAHVDGEDTWLEGYAKHEVYFLNGTKDTGGGTADGGETHVLMRNMDGQFDVGYFVSLNGTPIHDDIGLGQGIMWPYIARTSDSQLYPGYTDVTIKDAVEVEIGMGDQYAVGKIEVDTLLFSKPSGSQKGMLVVYVNIDEMGMAGRLQHRVNS